MAGFCDDGNEPLDTGTSGNLLMSYWYLLFNDTVSTEVIELRMRGEYDHDADLYEGVLGYLH
jgi:hypothetical protein